MRAHSTNPYRSLICVPSIHDAQCASRPAPTGFLSQLGRLYQNPVLYVCWNYIATADSNFPLNHFSSTLQLSQQFTAAVDFHRCFGCARELVEHHFQLQLNYSVTGAIRVIAKQSPFTSSFDFLLLYFNMDILIFKIGVYNIPIICLGYFFGGLFMKKFKINTYQAAHIACWVTFLDYLLYFTAFWTICDTSPVAGLTVSYEGYVL